MSRRAGGRFFFSGVNVNLWQRERRCIRELVYVLSLSRMGWYVVVLTVVGNGVFTGVLAACAVVCVRGLCGGLQVGVCLVGVPHVHCGVNKLVFTCTRY
jgi:hypothetical protein